MSSVNNYHHQGDIDSTESSISGEQGFDGRMKQRMLILLAVLACVFMGLGMVLRWLGASGWLLSDALWLLTASVLVALWAVYDHGHNSAGALDWDQMLFMFWPLTLCVWLWRTRGLVGIVLYLSFWGLLVTPIFLPRVLLGG